MRRVVPIATISLGLLASTACDYSGDWLFPEHIPSLPDVIHIGEIVPSQIDVIEDIEDAVHVGEVGAPRTTRGGGVTFSFVGDGGDVCLFVDPELVSWNQAVATEGQQKYKWPTNTFHDGDVDLKAGLAVYYTGSPGERIGDFEIQYQDSLGNKIPIELNECQQTGYNNAPKASGGRGAPEFCTIANTQPNVTYVGLLETFSTPIDDHRLSYGLLVVRGTCNRLRSIARAEHDECVILGESIDWNTKETVTGSIELETRFCATDDSLYEFCELEAAAHEQAGIPCSYASRLEDQAGKTIEYQGLTFPADHCLCGDIGKTPTGGAN